MSETDAERLKREEALYERVKHRLEQAERDHIEKLRQDREAGNSYNAYGHDLIAAINRADRRAMREQADAFVAVCKSNPFAAYSEITEALIRDDRTPPSGETITQALKRALESELRDIDKLHERWHDPEQRRLWYGRFGP